MPTIFILTIFDKFEKSLGSYLPILTFIGTKKIYRLFNIFVVKPNDMYLFGNLHVFKGQFSVALDLCAAVLL